MNGICIVESGLVSGNYNSGGGRIDTNHLSQFGHNREHRVIRLEGPKDEHSIGI